MIKFPRHVSFDPCHQVFPFLPFETLFSWPLLFCIYQQSRDSCGINSSGVCTPFDTFFRRHKTASIVSSKRAISCALLLTRRRCLIVANPCLSLFLDTNIFPLYSSFSIVPTRRKTFLSSRRIVTSTSNKFGNRRSVTHENIWQKKFCFDELSRWCFWPVKNRGKKRLSSRDKVIMEKQASLPRLSWKLRPPVSHFVRRFPSRARVLFLLLSFYETRTKFVTT